ncbi:sensor domain-containing diguanylate cyclase [Marinomonas profundimaris]|uniref:diguanylate cyclase n=1 Tax=Marinomonas profundimaris TaxID=1208321 RepID=W1RNG3_9GAMM|nr:sensor domain-containing diguanylate cyclase [Marinomonas profundimaris]ETI57882.1 diguanylate cyclase [Marinomonas profundimaris]
MGIVKSKFLKLNRLILFLALSATIITFINSFYSNYEVQKEQLIFQAIEVNRAYAQKLSDTTEVFISSSKQQLAYAANEVSSQMDNDAFLMDEANRLKYQTDSFNSVVISDALGRTQAASPETLDLVGKQLKSAGSKEALEEKKALISKPYVSTIQNLLVFISAPIFDKQHNYLGFLGGSIYLKSPNILNQILGEHYYKDGSYIYVVDKNRQILYHPQKERIGTFLNGNSGLDEIISKKEGGLLLKNSKGIEMLAGYSSIPSTDWIVITQSPLESTLLPLTGIMEKVILRTLPMASAVFLFIWLFARAISRPLQQLAERAKSLDSPTVTSDIESIDSWYVESFSLKKAMLSGVKLLHNQIGDLKRDADTDPLTGANNRRAFQYKLKQLALLETPFAILALDIDYFKRINDEYGHSVGDEVLKQQTQILQVFSRDGDLVARTGGEEFVLLLKDVTVEDAFIIAERLRVAIAEEAFETVGHVTASIGISAWTANSISIEKTLSLADQALYQAKKQGRNCCVMRSLEDVA